MRPTSGLSSLPKSFPSSPPTIRQSRVAAVFGRTILLAVILLCVLTLPNQALSAQQQEEVLTAERVASSIDRAIKYLRREQKTSGNWSVNGRHRGGVTALVTLALLNSGVEPSDRMIQNALQYLDGIDLDVASGSVYGVSLMTMVYCQADPDTRIARIRECVDYLASAQVNRGRAVPGGWSYSRVSGRPDASNSQFALLALHEASLLDINVDQSVWGMATEYWSSVHNERSGGFRYEKGQTAATGSMTCAGISSMIIIDENIRKKLPLVNGKIRCCGEDDRLEEVEKATAWLGKRFTVRRNPAESGSRMFSESTLYYLYGMERAARLSGVRFFGEHDWYREGADYLLRTQRNVGSWVGRSTHGENDANVATAFSLLFLSKGRRPIVIGKYKHSEDNDWDRHRKGVHYLTRKIEADWDKKLNWQTIEGRYASVDDLLEAPVLFISGRDSLRLGKRQKDALRKYIEFGGFLFVEACQGDGCGENSGFERDFKALMDELVPNSKLQLLDANHPVYSAQYQLNVNPDRPLYGLQSSCRTSIIYCPRNLAGLWRLNRESFMTMMPDGPRGEVNYATQLGINVVSYATGRELKDKLDRNKTADALNEGQGQRVVLIPKLSHGGGADDAPNAWQNIVRRARHDLKQRFLVERQMIQAETSQLARYPMTFMHGRSKFGWNESEKVALKAYFDNGGFLFADTICSSNGFAEAFRVQIKKVLPGSTLEVIPATDPIWSERAGGYQLDSVQMHEPAQVEGGVRNFKTPPKIEGIKIDGRWAIVFSPHDLSCAMENAAARQCPGYNKDDAARLGVNIILYALQPN